MTSPQRAYRRGVDGKAIIEAAPVPPEAPPETWPIVAVRKPRQTKGDQ